MPATPTHLFNTTIDIQRATDPVAVDDLGAPMNQFVSHLLAVPCRIAPMNAQEVFRYGRKESINAFTIALAPDTDVIETDRVIFEILEYDILGIRKDSMGCLKYLDVDKDKT